MKVLALSLVSLALTSGLVQASSENYHHIQRKTLR